MYRSRRTAATWGARTAWTLTAASISGLAVEYQGDYSLIVCGTAPTSTDAKVWACIFGDGLDVTANTWSALVEVTTAVSGSHGRVSGAGGRLPGLLPGLLRRGLQLGRGRLRARALVDAGFEPEFPARPVGGADRVRLSGHGFRHGGRELGERHVAGGGGGRVVRALPGGGLRRQRRRRRGGAGRDGAGRDGAAGPGQFERALRAARRPSEATST